MADQNYWAQPGALVPAIFDADDSKMLAHARGDGEAKAKARIESERIAADAEATRYLAEMNCPDDLRTFGANHGIPTFAEATWMAGFVAGWRLAVARGNK
jgi:hypothetical protein